MRCVCVLHTPRHHIRYLSKSQILSMQQYVEHVENQPTLSVQHYNIDSATECAILHYIWAVTE
jgi:hypothetical protein